MPLLKWLSEARPRTSKAILKVIDKDVLNAISECSLNVLKGNIPLTQAQKRRLAKHKEVLRALAGRKKVSDKNKRRLVQRGGFLGSLLGPIIGVLGHLLLQ